MHSILLLQDVINCIFHLISIVKMQRCWNHFILLSKQYR